LSVGKRTHFNARLRWSLAHPRLDGDDTFLIIDSRTGHQKSVRVGATLAVARRPQGRCCVIFVPSGQGRPRGSPLRGKSKLFVYTTSTP